MVGPVAAQIEYTSTLLSSKTTTMFETFRLRLGYAMGHVLNDLCCAMYFSYLLVFLELTGLSPVQAGWVLIVGQLVDGITTPIVGWMSDRFSCGITCCFGLGGRRKSWYIAGMLLVSASFWALFTPARIEHIPPTAYYAIANSFFQVGWATVQVSHMTIVPELTPLLLERTVLNSIRFAVTVGASIIVYLLVWVFSATSSVEVEANDEEVEIRQENEGSLRASLQIICYIVILIGALFGLIFIYLVREMPAVVQMEQTKPNEPGGTKNETAQELEEPSAKTLREWFVYHGFWGVTTNYVVTRLCVNALQIYIPFFVLYETPESPTTIATVPLTTFVGMCLSSAVAPYLSLRMRGAAKLYTAGVVCLFVGGGILFFLTTGDWVYVASMMLGIGSAQLMVTSQTLVGELVGTDSNGGVVFGIDSLGDKVSTGIVIFFIQRCAGTMTTEEELAKLYWLTATCVPVGCAIFGLLSLSSVPRIIRDRNGCEEESNGVAICDRSNPIAIVENQEQQTAEERLEI